MPIDLAVIFVPAKGMDAFGKSANGKIINQYEKIFLSHFTS
jgi:hypothetical protein